MISSLGQHAVRHECASPDFSRGDASSAVEVASKEAVAELWRACWSQLDIAHPGVEQRLAQLEHTRPTRHRALARLEASAARWSGRVLRGEAKPGALLRRLLTFELAVLDELEKTT